MKREEFGISISLTVEKKLFRLTFWILVLLSMLRLYKIQDKTLYYIYNI